MSTTWERLQLELEACAELDADARERHLRELEREAPHLARELRSLLAHATLAERIEPSGAWQQAAPSEEPARRVGPWLLLRRLGRGGMGEVWVGERAAGGFVQRAAVKLVAQRSDDAVLREQFRRERALLAGLEHAAIARLIDGGESESGEPYLAMELVEGERIDRWCDQQALGVRERLELFAQVADAVHYAHQRSIVHRDIKPANVLVSADGRPKLLDFGVAKLLDQLALDAPTVAGFFTPRYASPEQVRGESVTTATDVYSLGVLLFELLTGSTPYVLHSGSALELARQVGDGPKRPMSAAIDPACALVRVAGSPLRLARSLRGDLDMIAMQALAAEPARRYASASDLARDVRAFLDGRPVAARPDRWTYRARKLIARNPWASAAIAALLVSLAIGLVVSLLATARAQRAERLALRRLDAVRELSRSLVFGVHDRVSRLGGSTEVRRFLVDTTLASLNELAQQGPLSSGLAHELASTYLRLAEVQGAHTRGGVGNVDGALESAARALELWRGPAREAPGAADGTLTAHGLLGDLQRIRGDFALSAEHAAQLEQLARARLARAGDDALARRELAHALGQRARLSSLEGDRAASLEQLEQARELMTEAGATASAHDLAILDIRGAEERLALGRFDAARAALEACLARLERASLDAPQDEQLIVDRGNALTALGRVHQAQREHERALEYMRRAVELLQPLRQTDPNNVVAMEALSLALEGLGGCLRTRQDLPAALEQFHAGLELMERLQREGLNDRELRLRVAQLAAHSGIVEQQLGRVEAARAHFEQALELTVDESTSGGGGESDVELRAAAHVGLVDLERAAGNQAQVGARLERLWEEFEALPRRFPGQAWPMRRRGTVAWRLATWLEERAGEVARGASERAADLQRAIELYELGATDGESMRERGWLLESEQRLVELFREDVRRCNEAVRALAASPGP